MLPSSPRSAGHLPLTLRRLGPGGLWLGGEAVALLTRKALGLVAYLALEGPASRSRLADLFWSENDEEGARRNLRRELARLVPELDDEPPPPLRSPEERLCLYDAFTEFMDQATRDRVALLSDDLQFFDAASIEMGLYAA